MSGNGSRNLSLQSVLLENAPLIIMYALGTALLARLRWPLGLAYLGYCFLSVFLYTALAWRPQRCSSCLERPKGRAGSACRRGAGV